MSKLEIVNPKHSKMLITELQDPYIKDNPLNYATFAFPWGKANTPLENYSGPREWQREELYNIAEFIKENKARLAKGLDTKTYNLAISSGRGPGKSAFVAMICNWMISCQMGSSTMVTANTDSQLTNRTFGEIGKWATLSINGYWWERTQKGLMPDDWLAEGMEKERKIGRKLWYVKGELWNEDNPDSFAGMHNELGELIIFDEASGIPQPIWTVCEGVFTEKTPYKFWLAFSNPRSNTGPFYDCFHAHSEFWRTRKIDSRSVEGAPQDKYEEIIKKWGEDSREARIEVKGEFPQQGDKQFISRRVVELATRRELDGYDDHAALRMGVDPARFGDDQTVIRFRRGRDARSIPAVVLKGADNMEVANKCAELIDLHNPDGVFIDAGGGAGIIDRLKEMGYHSFEVGFGTKADEEQYYDRRTELWAKMRDWLGGAMIGANDEADKDLVEDLVGPEFETMGREQKIKLESKDKMKKRSKKNKSPDNADALAVTFDREIARKDLKVSRQSRRSRTKAKNVGCDVNWDKE